MRKFTEVLLQTSEKLLRQSKIDLFGPLSTKNVVRREAKTVQWKTIMKTAELAPVPPGVSFFDFRLCFQTNHV